LIDPFGLEIVNKGPDAKFWDHYLKCWKNLPKDSQLRKIVDELEKSKQKVFIEQLKGKKDVNGNQVQRPETTYNPLPGNSTMLIEPRTFRFNGDIWSASETLAHELLHAHDHLINTQNRGRGHGDGFMREERDLRNEIGVKRF